MKRYVMTVEVLVEVADDADPNCLVVEDLVYGSMQAGVGPDDVAVLEYETVAFETAWPEDKE